MKERTKLIVTVSKTALRWKKQVDYLIVESKRLWTEARAVDEELKHAQEQLKLADSDLWERFQKQFTEAARDE